MPIARGAGRAGAIALALAALAGCGSGHRSDAAGPRHARQVTWAGGAPALAAALGPGSIGPPAYRWLVSTAGPPPSVDAENRAQGTRAWRLPGPSSLIGGAATGAVEGYVADQVVMPGQTESVYVNAPGARSVRIAVFRMGWYGGEGGREVLVSRPLPVERQPPCAHSPKTGVTECDWEPTLTFPLPEGLVSGVYVVKLTTSNGAARDCLFVLRAAHRPRLVVEIPTATYEAYNAWGGDSLYPGGSLRVAATGTGQAVEVSYDRPYGSETGAGQFFIREVALVRFLERYGYPVGYTTDASIDADPGQLRGVRAVIDAGHSEYWSAREAAAFVRARDRGTSLLFLSSDTLAWRIRYGPAGGGSSERGVPGHTIVAYKEYAARDPRRASPTGLYPDGGAPLAGSAYDGCITPRLRSNGPPRYRFYGWRPDPALAPRWLFAGTGITRATAIPGIVGYELDGLAPFSPPGVQVVGASAGVRCQAATEPSTTRGAIAQTTLYRAHSGALVFAAGTLGWLYGLYPVPEASPDVRNAPDPRVVAITRNLLARVLAPGGRGAVAR